MTRIDLYIDGASRGNPGPSGAGVVATTPHGKRIREGAFVLKNGTNNQAEYRALLHGLAMAADLGAREVLVHSDSELLVRQMTGVYKVRNEMIREMFKQAQEAVRRFERVDFEHVPRERNREADRLANLAIDTGTDTVVPG